jgi:hypothetical protein
VAQGGSRFGPPGTGGNYADGGGIRGGSNLTITHSIISENTADGKGSGAWGSGGGISAYGRLQIRESALCGNRALGGSGFVSGWGSAGGARIYGTADFLTTTVCNNTALGGTGYPGGSATAGGIYAYYTLTIQSSYVYSNAAVGGSSTWSTGGAASGGAVVDLEVFTLVDTTVMSNTARGGSSNSSTGGSGTGGGILEGESGVLRIVQSAILSNTAQGGASVSGLGGGASGGGFSDSTSTYSPTAHFINSTLVGNRALRGASPTAGELSTGGGLRAGFAAVDVSFCTITDNSADDSGGGVYSITDADDQGPVLKNTIVHGNSANAGPDLYANVQSRGYNLIGTLVSATLDTTGGANTNVGNLIGVNPKLGPLGDNGGPTWTRALAGLPNPSPAINAGSGTDIEGSLVTVDQRGFPRPFPPGAQADIGAYEFQSTLSSAFVPAVIR